MLVLIRQPAAPAPATQLLEGRAQLLQWLLFLGSFDRIAEPPLCDASAPPAAARDELQQRHWIDVETRGVPE